MIMVFYFNADNASKNCQAQQFSLDQKGNQGVAAKWNTQKFQDKGQGQISDCLTTKKTKTSLPVTTGLRSVGVWV